MQGLAGNRCLSPGSLICKWHCFLKGLKQTDVPGHLPLLLVSSHSPGPCWAREAGSLPQQPADTWQRPAHAELWPGVGLGGSLAGPGTTPFCNLEVALSAATNQSDVLRLY